MKWLMSRVLPGVDEVLARPLWLHNIFMRLDLPTLERPMNAYSALTSFGHIVTVGADMTNSELFISIFGCVFV